MRRGSRAGEDAARGAGPAGRLRSRISLRASAITLLVSLATMAIASGLQYRIQYASLVAKSVESIREVQSAQTPAAALALWNYDFQGLKTIVGGIAGIPYVNYAEVFDLASGKSVSAGVPSSSSLVIETELRHGAPELHRSIGRFSIQIDRRAIVDRVMQSILKIVGFELLFLVVESALIFAIFKYLVTDRLSALGAQLGRMEADDPLPLLRSSGKSMGDELDRLAESFNETSRKLYEERAKTEKALSDLRESEERNRVLIERAPDAILLYDPDLGRYVDCNPEAERLFGLSPKEILGKGPFDLQLPAQPDGLPLATSVVQNRRRVMAGETVVTRRLVRGRGGEPRLCELRLAPVVIGGRALMRASYLDITESVATEEKLKKTVREKEVLLQEIYHRTKNNMQVIASLINLESPALDTDRDRELFKELNSRINSMALVHQMLYESRDLSNIHLGDYLRELADMLSEAYRCGPRHIAIETDAEGDIGTTIDTAIPCGLVVNELLLNSITHAFPSGGPGRIRVELRRLDVSSLRVVVEDDGVGLKEGFSLGSDSGMGLKVIYALISQQLEGTVAFRSAGGLRWEITIRNDLYPPRI